MRRPALAAVVVLGSVSGAWAQPLSSAARPARLELAVGVGLFGGAVLDASHADLRSNSPAPDPFRLFAATARMGASPTLEVRASAPVSRRWGIEARFAFNRPELRVSVTDDAEGAPPVTVVERLDQYVIEAGIVAALDRWRVGSLIPFAAAGGGYLRQLHEGRTLVEEGQVYHLGGGVKHLFFTRTDRRVRGAGIRVDARLYLLTGGVSSGGARAHAAAAGSLFLAF